MADYKSLFLTLTAVLVFLAILANAGGGSQVCSGGCDYDRIQEAVDAAEVGETILVQSGTYQHDLMVNKSCTLHGLDSGMGRPSLQGNITIQYAVLRGFDFSLRPASSLFTGQGAEIYQNEFQDAGKLHPQASTSWNSSHPLGYQFKSSVLYGRLGNYWADYAGADSNNDGIGDQPKVIDDDNIDYYPLMQPLKNYKFSDEDEGGEELIRAKVYEPFTISLPANPSTAYQWFVDYDYYLLRLENESFEKSSSRALGSGGTSTFVFSPVRPGKTTISLVYKRPWENIVARVRSFRVEIVD